MTDIRDRHLRESAIGRRAALAFASTLLGPLAAVLAMAGLRFGWWDYGVAWGAMTLWVALPLSLLGAAGAAFAVLLAARRPKVAGLAALGAVVVSGAVLALFFKLLVVQSDSQGPDVSTDPVDPPGFPAELIAQGAVQGAPSRGSGCAVAAYGAQSAPGAAGYVLQQGGFDIQSLGVGRAVGTRHGVWFGTTWDAAIRIRPGRTDVRVAARQPDQDRGEACRLAVRLAEALKPTS